MEWHLFKNGIFKEWYFLKECYGSCSKKDIVLINGSVFCKEWYLFTEWYLHNIEVFSKKIARYLIKEWYLLKECYFICSKNGICSKYGISLKNGICLKNGIFSKNGTVFFLRKVFVQRMVFAQRILRYLLKEWRLVWCLLEVV